MRIVIDTNVLVMVLRSSRGASFALLSELPSSDFELALTVPLYMEYLDVLSRPEILKLGYTLENMKDVTRYLSSISHKQAIYYLWRPWLKDPKDDMVLEAAFASRSEYIVTYNTKDFMNKEIDRVFGIRPINAKEILADIGRISE